MDTQKYPFPKLPAAQNILEDLSDPDVIKTNQPLKLSADEEIIRSAYSCYRNYKQLDSDLQEQASINSNLEELNKSLVENIGNMKKQMQTK